MFKVIHMWKCRNVRTTLPKIHLQKYMVKEEANYWAKKAVSFKHLHAKKEKDSANGMLSLYNAIVYREKKSIYFREAEFVITKGTSFFPSIPLTPKLTCPSQQHFFYSWCWRWMLSQTEVTKSPRLRGDLHSNRQYQGNKTTNHSFVVLTTIVIMIRSIIIHNKWSYFNGHQGKKPTWLEK